jgi:hypothetical protein
MDVHFISNPAARYNGITPVAMRVSVLWDMMPWCLVQACTGKTFYCHFESGRWRQYLSQKHRYSSTDYTVSCQQNIIFIVILKFDSIVNVYVVQHGDLKINDVLMYNFRV